MLYSLVLFDYTIKLYQRASSIIFGNILGFLKNKKFIRQCGRLHLDFTRQGRILPAFGEKARCFLIPGHNVQETDSKHSKHIILNLWTLLK